MRGFLCFRAARAKATFASSSPGSRLQLWTSSDHVPQPSSLLYGLSQSSLQSSGTSLGSSAVWGSSIRSPPSAFGLNAPYSPDSDSDSGLDELLEQFAPSLGSSPFSELHLDDHVEIMDHASPASEDEDSRCPTRRRVSSAGSTCSAASSSADCRASSLATGPATTTVDIPEDTVSQFMHYASDNTDRSVETSAVLAGRWRPDAGGIRRLELAGCIIPEQVGTENTTEITSSGETSYGELLFSEDLISLGWIHTHPTQDCFLSSVDLHSTLGFQSALPQALAMVCAPSKERSVGIFRLTPSGMQTLSSCSERGFHVHPDSSVDQPLYHEAMGVKRNPDITCKIFDLR